MKIIGDSMSPLIPGGSEIFLENTSHYNVGDVVVFKDNLSNTFSAHRVISKDPLLTKGDNSLVMDTLNKEVVFAKIIRVKNKTKSYTLSNSFINYIIAKTSYYSKSSKLIRYPFKVSLIIYTKFKLLFSV